MNLDEMSLSDLKKLQDEVAIAIFNYEKRKKQEALAAVKELAKDKGFALDDLLDVKKASKSPSKSAPKYRHPENAEITWTGKGRRPKWVVEHLDAGGAIDDLEI